MPDDSTQSVRFEFVAIIAGLHMDWQRGENNNFVAAKQNETGTPFLNIGFFSEDAHANRTHIPDGIQQRIKRLASGIVFRRKQ